MNYIKSDAVIATVGARLKDFKSENVKPREVS